MIAIALAAVVLSASPDCPPDWEPDMQAAGLRMDAREAVDRLYHTGELSADDFSTAMQARFHWDQGRDPNWQDFDWVFGLTQEPDIDCLNVTRVVRDTADRGQVLATFQNGGVPVSREYTMVREDRRWKIDDIAMEPEGWMLSEYLAIDPEVRRHQPPGEDQRRGPSGMRASDGIAEMMQNLYAAAEDGPVPARYLSADLQRLFADDAIREWNRVNFDWLRGGQEPGEVTDFRAWVLNVSPAMDGHGATAPILVQFKMNGEEVSRRFHLMDADGHWIVSDVCMFPERQSLRAVLEGHEDAAC